MSNQKRADLDLIKEELEVVRANGGGMLYPSAIVVFAQDDATELHKRFNWDNDSAGHQHRLWQARHLIKVIVDVYGSDGDTVEVPVYVSLSSDRKSTGYRSMREVYAEDELRLILLADAKREMQRFTNKYKLLKELENVFRAMNEASQ